MLSKFVLTVALLNSTCCGGGGFCFCAPQAPAVQAKPSLLGTALSPLMEERWSFPARLGFYCATPQSIHWMFLHLLQK